MLIVNKSYEKGTTEMDQGDAPNQSTATSNIPSSFDPSRMIGIIKRKALIKDLAAAYHAECLTCCRELLELQKKWEEQLTQPKESEDTRKEMMKSTRPLKRSKKAS